MPGTATNYDETVVSVDSIAQIWANVAIPTAGNRLTLHTDGTPESVANPSAKHLGLTAAGATLTMTQTVTDSIADELPFAIASSVDAVTMEISASLLQVFDPDVLAEITRGFGTAASGSGYQEYAIGRKAMSYTGIAMIWPTTADPTKYAVAHLYRAMNVNGLTLSRARIGRSEIPVTFRAYGIASRALTDSLGKYWFQTA